MSDIKSKQVNIYIDQTAAETALDKLQTKADGFNKKIDDARNKQKALRAEIEKTSAAGGSITKLEKQYQSLEKEVAATTSKLKDTTSSMKKVQDQIDKGLRPSFAQQEKLVISLRNQLKLLSEDAPGYAAKFKTFQNASAELDRMRTAMNGVEKAQNSWLQQAKVVAFGVLIGNTVQQAVAAVGNYLSGIVTGNAKLSDSLADLQRVSGLTSAEVKALYEDLRKIDTRTSTSGLLSIAIVAGKLGVAKDDIVSFTQAVDKLVVALGDELGDANQITEELGKILNVFDGKVTGENITTLGNAIVDLANKGIASGAFLVDFTQRVSGVAKASNLSLPAVLGLASGLEASGAKVESASTAVQKLLTTMATDLPKAAQIAGVPIAQFQQLFADKPQEALLQYAAGLQKNKDSFAEVAAGFKDAGEDGARTIAVLSTLGLKTDYFRGQMDAAGKAIKNTNEIEDAFNLKNQTLGAQLDKLGKSINSLITSKSLSEFFASAVGALNKFVDALKAAPEWIKENQTGFYLIAAGIAIMNASYIKAGILIVRDTAIKIYNATVTKATAIATDIATAAQATYIIVTNLLTGKISIATAAVRLFNTAMSLGAGPIGLIVVAIGALVVGIGTLINNTDKLTTAQKINIDLQQRISSTSIEEAERIKELVAVINNQTTSLSAKKLAYDELIKINPAFVNTLTLENLKTAEGKKLVDEYIQSLQTKAEAEAKASLLTDKLKERDDAFAKLRGDKTYKNSSDEDLAKAAQDQKNLVEKHNIIYEFKVNGVKLSELADNINEIKSLQDDLNKFKEKSLEDQVKAQAEGDKKTVSSSATTIAALEKQLQDLQAARKTIPTTNKKDLDENAKQILAIQKELSQFEIKSFDQSTKSAENKYDELLKSAEEFNKKVRDLQQVSTDASRTQNQKEISDIKHKYDEVLIAYNDLQRKLKGSKISLAFNSNDIKKLEAAEISGTLAKQQTETDKQEYENQLAVTEKYFAEKKQLTEQDFVAGKFDKVTYEANILQIDADSKAQQVQNAKDYSVKVKEAAADVTKFQTEQLNAQVQAQIKAYQRQEKNKETLELLSRQATASRDHLGITQAAFGTLKMQYDANKKNLDDQLKDQVDFLNKKRDADIKAADGDGAAILEINKKYDGLISDAAKESQAQQTQAHENYLSGLVEKYTNYANTIISLFSQIGQNQTDHENRVFQEQVDKNNKLKQSYQKLLNGKLLTQQEYNIRVAALDEAEVKKKEELNKKQFAREKKLKIAQALANAASSIAMIFATVPPVIPGTIFPNPEFPIALAIAAATNAAQIAIIAGQKYGKGGLLAGPSHDNGGIQLVDRNSKQVFAEAEGGEPILSKETYRNNKPVVDALLHSSMNQGGAAVDPAYFTRTYRPVAAGSIIKTFQTLKFAAGGVLPGTNNNSTAPAPADPALVETLQQSQAVNVQLMQTVLSLTEQLKKPIKGDWNLKQLDDAQDQRARIRADATFNG